MYQIGEYVVYNNRGACKIMDICTLPHSKNKTDLYYMLQPAFDYKSKIYIPVNNDKIFMRKIYTKPEVNQLLKSAENLEPIWIEDRKERGIEFKEALKSHDSQSCIRILKGLNLEKQAKSADGKILNNSDSEMIDDVEKLLYREFAVALDIPVESVAEYITTYLT